jgi:hypothetical protein
MADKKWSEAQKGTYSAGTSYVIGDFTVYNGSSYTCIANSTGNLPTDTSYWALVVSKGDTGATGAKGDKGDTGSTGATGNGIDNITKTGTVGLVDTYTVTYTDTTTDTFDVTNGKMEQTEQMEYLLYGKVLIPLELLMSQMMSFHIMVQLIFVY